MTENEIMRRGAEHAKAGKQCTPFDCREVDAELFAEMKNQERPAQWYAIMRGAFNDSWQRETVELTLFDAQEGAAR